MKSNLQKRILCVFLALALVLGNVPVTALAEEEDVPAAEETLLLETTPTSEPETVPETEPETIPETVPETVPETILETVPETTVETEPEPILAAAESESVMAAAAGVSVIASGSCGKDASGPTWKLTDDGLLTISGTGEMKTFDETCTAPWDSYREDITKVLIEEGVTSISPYAFYECNRLSSIDIPDSVSSIGKYAFSGCFNLRSVEIPEGVTSIESHTFFCCFDLTSVTIPGSVTSIGEEAFYNCASLTSVDIWEGVTSIGTKAFYDCTSLAEFTIPGKITSIGKEAFWGCSSLASVNIPGSVTSIQKYTFCGCASLTSATIQEGVTSIGEEAFRGCSSLTSVTIPGSVTSIERSAFRDCSSLTSVTIPTGVTSIEDYTFYCCASLTSVTIPDRVFSIGDSAFAGCASLTSVTIPDRVTSIGWSAFAGCHSLTSVTIPDRVTTIEGYTFNGCNGLTSVTIPDRVTSIGQGAFWGCTGLTSVTIPAGVTSIGQEAFRNCTGLTSVTIPAGVTSIGEGAFYGCTGLTSVTIPAGVTSIGRESFYGCTGLTSVIIPDSVTSIGGYAFYGCTSLTAVNIPEGVTSIGYSAFQGCTSLTSVTIPEAVTSIEDYTFYGCASLTSVTIPDSVTSIGGSAFARCTSLTEVTIPAGVTSIGSCAFYICTSLTSVIIPDSVTSIEHSAFYGCTGLTEVTIPAGVTSIEYSTFQNCTSLTSVIIPEGVTSIGGSAFYGCTGLTSVNIPGSVTSIGGSAFYGCASLTSVTIPAGVTSIGTDAFSGCTGLTAVTYAGTMQQWKDLYTYSPYYAVCSASCSDGTIWAWGSCGKEGDNLTWTLTDGLLTISGTGEMKSPTSDSYVPWYSHREKITDISMEEGITTIGQYAFRGCTGLTAVTIPESVTGISSGAFYDCTSLTKVTIPAGVTSVGSSAFLYCTSLTAVNYAGTMQQWQDMGCRTPAECSDGTIWAWGGIGWTSQTYTLIDGRLTIQGSGDMSFYIRIPWYEFRDQITSVSLADGITSIDDYAFKDCVNLTSVSIPYTVTGIGTEAFKNCSSLESLTILNSETRIADNAFSLGSDSKLKSLTIPGELYPDVWQDFPYDTLESITFTGNRIVAPKHRSEDNGSGGFEHSGDAVACRNVRKIIISDSVEVIEPHAFCGCDRLTEVAGCENVTSIGAFAFYNCKNLESINLPATLESIGEACFMEDTRMQLIDMSNVPHELVEYRTLISGKASLPSVLVNATSDKAEISWRLRSLGDDGEDPLKCVRWYSASGKLYLEAMASGTFVLEAFDSYTGAQGSKVIAVKTGTVIRPAEPEYLVSGQKLQFSAWQTPSNTKTTVKWSLGDGDEQYASLSSAGLLTAKSVSQAYQITITATPLNGDDSVTRTIWILPKATSIQLKLGDSNLGDTLNVDTHPGRTLTLSAQSYPEGALNEVSWTSSNTRIATVHKQTGQVTLLTPGTVTITATATDGSGVKASVKLNVIYLDAAKTLKAFAEVPPIGLQPGQTTAITVSGENPIAPENLIYTTSNASIATVNDQGVLTAGTKPGTVTITAALKGDPLKRKATVKVPVIAMQAEELSVAVNGDVMPELTLDRDSTLRTYTLTAPGKNYLNEDFTPNVTWVSMDPAVARVTVARDGTVTLTIPANASGECFVTATSKDLAKITARLKITVMDFTPRLNSTKLTLNSNLAAGTSVSLLESYENRIQSVTLHEYDGARKVYREEPSTRFHSEYDSESGTLTIRTESPVANKTYPLKMMVSSDRGKYTYNLQVKVANALPAVTVKQTEKFNLFYLDSAANLNVAAPGQTITSVELADTKDFYVDYSDGTASLHYTENPSAKPDTKATLLVYLEGYNTPVSKSIVISTVTTAPKLSLSPASSTINTVLNDSHSVDLKIWNQTEGGWLIPDIVEYTAGFAAIAHIGDTLTLTLDGNSGGTATIWVRQSNWAQAVKLTHKVTVSSKLPVIKLGSTKLALNSYFTEQPAATPVTLSQGNLALNTVTLTSTAEAGTAAAVEAGKLNVYYSRDDGCIQAEIPNDAPKAGTYTYSVKGILSDGQTELSGGTLKVTVSAALPKVNLPASSVKLNRYLAGQETATLNVSVPAGYVLEGFDGMDETLGVEGNVLTVRLTGNEAIGKRTLRLYPILKDEATNQSVTLPTALKLTVQVYESSKLGVSLSAKGKLDTLNPDSAIVYTPKLTNCIGTIDRVSLTGQDADKFHAELEDGKIVLTLRDGEAYATNVTYKVQFQISTCGEEILSPVMNVKITQSKVKLTAAPAALILYQSQGTPLTLRLTQSVGEIAEVSINGKTSAELIAALGEDGLYAEVDGSTAGLELTAGNAALLNAGKSYTLYLDITPKNNATNLKPAQVKLTVKVMK